MCDYYTPPLDHVHAFFIDALFTWYQFHRGNMYAKRRYTVRLPVQSDKMERNKQKTYKTKLQRTNTIL